jgi:hypothetical protein
MTEPEKFCKKCGEWWPADGEFFFRRTRNPDGLDWTCRACYSEQPSVRRLRTGRGTPRLYSPWEKLFETEARA